MPSLRNCGKPLRRAMIAVADSVENELNPSRNAQLVEDPKQVFLDGVLAQTEFLRHLTIGEALGYKRDDLFLAGSEQAGAAGVDHAQGRYLAYSCEQRADLSPTR